MIIKPYIDDEKSDDFKRFNQLHTGVDISMDEVITFSSGIVIHIGKDSDEGGYSITIKFSDEYILRYNHLSSYSVNIGDVVGKGDIIGVADRWLHFELATPEEGIPLWPVRLDQLTLYKHNPTSIVDGSLSLDDSAWFSGLNMYVTRPDDLPDFVFEPDPNEDISGSTMF